MNYLKKIISVLIAVFISVLTASSAHAEIPLDAELKYGSFGDDVFEMQADLYILGYIDEEPDGVFGDMTMAALMKFQEDCGLYADGTVGPDTIYSLNIATEGLFSDEAFVFDPGKIFGEKINIEEEVLNIFDGITAKDMTPEEKLEAVFYYMADRDNYEYELNRVPYYLEFDWPWVYAEDILRYKASDCHGHAALFGLLAGLCGVSDEIYWVCAGDGAHAWVEIDGLIYDPLLLESKHWNGLVYGWTYEEAEACGFGLGYADYVQDPDDYIYVLIPAEKDTMSADIELFFI